MVLMRTIKAGVASNDYERVALMAPQACPAYDTASFKSTTPELEVLLGQVDAISRDSRSLQGGPVSESAASRTKSLLREVAQYEAIPDAAILPFESGLQVIWHRGNKNLKLFCSDAKTYIYKNTMNGRRISDSDIINDVHSFSLAKQLHWLVSSL